MIQCVPQRNKAAGSGLFATGPDPSHWLWRPHPLGLQGLSGSSTEKRDLTRLICFGFANAVVSSSFFMGARASGLCFELNVPDVLKDALVAQLCLARKSCHDMPPFANW